MKNVSVIVPVYNSKEYLERALNSIFDQKEYIKEIIIINDGSTDGSDKFIEEHYSTIDFVRIFHTKNRGQGPARNLGVEVAKGEFVYFFDSDDISINNLFKKFNNILSSEPDIELFAFSGQSFLDEKYSAEKAPNRGLLSDSAYKRKINNTFLNGEEAFNELVPLRGFFSQPSLYISKKSVIEDNHLKFGTFKHEDEPFVYELFLVARKTVIDNEVHFRRRLRAGSDMQQKKGFNYMYGYIQTFQILERLKLGRTISEITKNQLDEKISRFAREVILLKNKNAIKLNPEEKKYYRRSLVTVFLENYKLFFFYLYFPVKLRFKSIKKSILG